MIKLSAKQQKILDFIQDYRLQNSNMPTLREIAAHFNITIGPVQKYIKILERKGAINKKESCARGIELTHFKKLVPIAIFGSVHAGIFLEPTEDMGEHIYVDGDIIRNRECFALKVRGDSMQPSGILEGDTIVVSKDSLVSNGDIVVAMIGDEAAIKIYSKLLDAKICLASSNPEYPPIHINACDCKILGKLIHLIRQY
jgi:repressor LexA